MANNLEGSLATGAHALLARMIGQWRGTSRLWFEPDKLESETPIAGTIRSVLDGRFVVHEYTGTVQGRPHQGLMLIGYFLDEHRWAVSWVDSFHNGTRIMHSHGSAGADPKVPDVLGNYPAPPGPDWGWRSSLEMPGNDRLVITMYNIDPQGNEAKAVEIDYRRI